MGAAAGVCQCLTRRPTGSKANLNNLEEVVDLPLKQAEPVGDEDNTREDSILTTFPPPPPLETNVRQSEQDTRQPSSIQSKSMTLLASASFASRGATGHSANKHIINTDANPLEAHLLLPASDDVIDDNQGGKPTPTLGKGDTASALPGESKEEAMEALGTLYETILSSDHLSSVPGHREPPKVQASYKAVALKGAAGAEHGDADGPEKETTSSSVLEMINSGGVESQQVDVQEGSGSVMKEGAGANAQSVPIAEKGENSNEENDKQGSVNKEIIKTIDNEEGEKGQREEEKKNDKDEEKKDGVEEGKEDGKEEEKPKEEKKDDDKGQEKEDGKEEEIKNSKEEEKQDINAEEKKDVMDQQKEDGNEEKKDGEKEEKKDGSTKEEKEEEKADGGPLLDTKEEDSNKPSPPPGDDEKREQSDPTKPPVEVQSPQGGDSQPQLRDGPGGENESPALAPSTPSVGSFDQSAAHDEQHLTRDEANHSALPPSEQFSGSPTLSFSSSSLNPLPRKSPSGAFTQQSSVSHPGLLMFGSQPTPSPSPEPKSGRGKSRRSRRGRNKAD